MSNKQLKKLLVILLGAFVVVALVFSALFFIDFENIGKTKDIETIKAEGNYEGLKADLMDNFSLRDSQVAAIANALFEDIGITSYESMSKQDGRRGNIAIYCDGYKLDSYILAGDLANVYIGNVLIFKNPKVSSVTIANAPEFTYMQYKSLVNSFKRALNISDDAKAKSLYEKLTMMDINSFTNVKKAKVNGMSGYMGYEGSLPYFLMLDSNYDLKYLAIYHEKLGTLEIYNSASPKKDPSSTAYKVLAGVRTGMPDVLEYKISKIIGMDIILPAALTNGDDSWLMIRKDNGFYLETRCEVGTADKMKAKDIIIEVLEENREIIYLQIGKDVYVGAN